MLELDAGVGGGEAPVDGLGGGVAVLLARRHLLLQGHAVGQPAVEALRGQHQVVLAALAPSAVGIMCRLGADLDLEVQQVPRQGRRLGSG